MERPFMQVSDYHNNWVVPRRRPPGAGGGNPNLT